MASTRRVSSIRRKAAGLRQVTTPAPPRGIVRRSASTAPRLSSSAAMAAMSVGGRAVGRYGGRVLRLAGRGVDLLDRLQRPNHLAGPLQDTPGVVIAEQVERLVQAAPLAVGDSFIELGTRLPVGALEQEEVAVLVDVAASESEMPIDDADRTLQHQTVEAGLFAGL